MVDKKKKSKNKDGHNKKDKVMERETSLEIDDHTIYQMIEDDTGQKE